MSGFFGLPIPLALSAGSVSAPSIHLGVTTSGFYKDGNQPNDWTFAFSSGASFKLSQAAIGFVSNGILTWGTQVNTFTSSTDDLAVRRATSKVLGINDGGSGGATWRTIAKTATQITANTDNYNPGGPSYFQRWSTDASRNITGLTFAATQVDGQCHLIINVGSFDIVLKEQTTSTAANQFLNSTGADITLSAKQAADIIYDGTLSRWLVFKRT